MLGKTLIHYEITAEIGKGGMGEVYQAKDTKLGRDVAIKVLPEEFARDTDRLTRFEREAKLLASLNHPNIAAIHGLEEAEGTHFLVMELIEGQTLSDRLKADPVSIEEALKLTLQIAEALEAAHTHGIIHRDLKPANIMITPEGRVKVLDFGLAKPFAGDQQDMIRAYSTTISEVATQQGVVLGTAAYMSPEQAEGKPVDTRSDIFSFGTVFYEVITGRRAFQGESYISTLSAVLRSTPTPVRKLRAGVPAALERIVNHCLEKNLNARYASAAEVINDLNTLQSQIVIRRMRLGPILRKPRFAIPVLIMLVVIALIIGWFWTHSSQIRWARTVALPEIHRLIEEQRPVAALKLIQQAEPYLTGDPEFDNAQQAYTGRQSFSTNPPGADFYICDYIDLANGDEWIHLGKTPLDSVAVPKGLVAFRISKPNYDTVEGADGLVSDDGQLVFPQTELRPSGTTPTDMIWVPAQIAGMISMVTTEAVRNLGLEGFWMDRYEVTNRQFKEFVDSGAYEKREYWKIPFVKEGLDIPWEDAMATFKDSTGKPGPATWEFGTYPQDRADYPVSGVSWYEAVAYSDFAGKSLPTVHHWFAAIGIWPDSTILKMSNFAGKGPAPIEDYKGLGPYGTYDMAGNVKEWCWNPAGAERYILGGGWNEPSYSFLLSDARNPMERSTANGFRCAKYVSLPTEELTGSVKLRIRDRRGDKAATDPVFQAYKDFHQYDHGELKAEIESVDDSSPYWRLEKVSFQAAYGNERVTGYLYLPKNATPPYQTVVHFPGAYAIETKTSRSLNTPIFDFIIRSGRALMHPIYKGTYERNNGLSMMNYHTGSNMWREVAIQCAKDLGRSLDYLETRPDIDQEKLAYYGFSMGAAEGPRMMVLEPRLKVGLLIAGGAYEREWPAEVDPFNFAPRVRVPILMANGEYDFVVPLAGSQIPLFQMLGTPNEDKRHFTVKAGHIGPNREIIKESLVWLDNYLGPVRTR